MMSIRTLLLGLGAVAVAAPALAQSCLQPTEHSAFQVRALQSQLMVAAIVCNRNEDYNAFMAKFQGDLRGAWTNTAGHFRRTAGGQHQRRFDSYNTELAAAQAQDQISQGSRFCQNLQPLFTAALSQPNASSLAQLAVERNIVNPLEAPSCAARTVSAEAQPAAATRRQASRPVTRTASAATTR